MGMSEHFDTEVVRRRKEKMPSFPARHSCRSDASKSKSLDFKRDKHVLCTCKRTGEMIVSKDSTVWTGRAEGKFRSSQDWK